MPVGKTRVTEVIDYAMLHGDNEAATTFGISLGGIERYRRKYKEIYGESADLVMALKKQLTDVELKMMLNTSKRRPVVTESNPVSIEGDRIKFGVITDTHIGHKEFIPEYLRTAFDIINNFGAQFTFHAGDVVEGLMNRPGHFFECSHYGYKAQRDESVAQLSYYNKPLYVINGNHDASINSKLGVGIDIVEDICERIPNAIYLPGDPADIEINGIRFRLFHGRDRGGSYAKSFRPQKILDSFGIDIPDVLMIGHAHSADYCKYKGCHLIDGGCIQRLTDFQRGNKLSADVGFWTVDMTVRNGKIIAISPTFYDLEEVMNG
jgi:DNA polymerase II small subunit/DNA polymerase delta subunit B